MIKILIGRSAECQICYEGISQISSKHAELIIGDDGRMMLTDYSTNGTMVNGQMVHHKSIPVSYGEEIMFPGNVALDWNLVASVFNQMKSNSNQQAAPSYPSYPSAPSAPSAPMPPQSAPSSSNGGGANSGNGTLSLSLTLSEGFTMGFRNSLSFLGTIILYGLTIWVPYINIGTTIAIASLPLLYAKNQSFSPFFIFESSYRKRMGDCLLLSVFMGSITIVSTIAMFFPALVIGLTYSLSLLFLLDREQDPIASMQSSQKATYGSKWTMFGAYLIFILCQGFVSGLLTLLVGLSVEGGIPLAIIVGLLSYVVSIIFASTLVGMRASIWKQLNSKIEA